MDTQTIAMIAAGIGVVATIAYVTIGVAGVKILLEIRNHLRRSRAAE